MTRSGLILGALMNLLGQSAPSHPMRWVPAADFPACVQESDPPFYFPALKIALSGESKRETREGIETHCVAYARFNQTGGTGLSGCWHLIYLKLVVSAFNASTWR